MPNTESNEPTILFLGGNRPTRHPQQRELTVKELAEQERVSQRTVWTWIRKDAVKVRRTPGGRVRIIGR